MKTTFYVVVTVSIMYHYCIMLKESPRHYLCFVGKLVIYMDVNCRYHNCTLIQ
jgi:hypothetical protein